MDYFYVITRDLSIKFVRGNFLTYFKLLERKFSSLGREGNFKLNDSFDNQERKTFSRRKKITSQETRIFYEKNFERICMFKK